MSAPIAAAVSWRGRSGQPGNGAPGARSPTGRPRPSAWRCLTAARRSLDSFARSWPFRPSAADRRLSHRRGLRAPLRFADIVDIVDVVTKLCWRLAVRPAGQIDPDHRHGLGEVDAVGRAFLDLGLHGRFVPATGRSFQQPGRVIVDALNPDPAVAEESVVGAEQL